MRSSFFLLLCLIACTLVHAQAPSTISYQGYLESGGLPVDGTVPMVVRLFAQESGGTAAWSQSFGSVTVSKGVYTLVLDVSTISFDKPYWLEVEMNGLVSSARTALTSAAYSLGPWATGSGGVMELKQEKKGPDGVTGGSTPIYYSGGNVGIGISTPVAALDIHSGSGDMFHLTGYEPFLTLYDANHTDKRTAIQSVNGGMNLFTHSYLTGGGPFSFVRLDDNGNLGVGSATPTAKLEVASLGGDILRLIGYEPYLTLYDANHGYRRGAIQQVDGGINLFSDSYLTGSNLGACIRMAYDGSVGIGTLNPQVKLEVAGRTKTQVLEITGGGDFSENFDVTDNVSGSTEIEPGMIVSIDPANPGKLEVSHLPYDNRVAGIISGAGGITPGMMMGQQGSIVNGKYPVALTGRVYCWADASVAPIEPGDMLTTSITAGHAMKAADKAKANGAIIGKAMTSLKQGKGLVLVLVNLQ